MSPCFDVDVLVAVAEIAGDCQGAQPRRFQYSVSDQGYILLATTNSSPAPSNWVTVALLCSRSWLFSASRVQALGHGRELGLEFGKFSIADMGGSWHASQYCARDGYRNAFFHVPVPEV